MLLSEAFENFILSRELADLSPKTVQDYQDSLKPFLAFLGPDLPLESIDKTVVDKYLAALMKRPLSKASKATYTRSVKIFLRWLENEYDFSFKAEKIKIPKSPRREPRIYTDDEIAVIFSAVDADSYWIEVRNKLVIALMLDSGLRQSEVCSLLRSRISLSENRMIVVGKGSKERTVPIGNMTKQIMTRYLEVCPYTRDELFVNRRGDPLTCNAVKLMVTKLAHKLPFELSSHKLRHNFATNYCLDQLETNNKVDIYSLMYIMGHEDISTTEIYLHFAYEILGARNHCSHLDKLRDIAI